jgi:hypothetical protein
MVMMSSQAAVNRLAGTVIGVSRGKLLIDLIGESLDVHLPSSAIFSLDELRLKQSLDGLLKKASTEEVVYFPTTDGEMIRFRVIEKSNFSPVLAAKFPDIKAYRGFSTDHPEITMYFSSSSQGYRSCPNRCELQC